MCFLTKNTPYPNTDHTLIETSQWVVASASSGWKHKQSGGTQTEITGIGREAHTKKRAAQQAVWRQVVEDVVYQALGARGWAQPFQPRP